MSTFSADKDVAKILYNVGESMIKDDKNDLAWTTYSNRRLHHYGGHRAPNHSSPFHHWQVGTALCFLSQFLALASTAIEAQQTYEEMQQVINEEESE